MGAAYFYRYTDLPSLIHILKNRQLTLLNPMTWDDKNDSNFVTLYKEKCQLSSVLALCFTRSSETYHHWRIFAPGSSGVRVTFDENHIRQSAIGICGLQLKDVEYVKIADIRNTKLSREKLPFLKRHPYQHEKEVRLLWESSIDDIKTFPFHITLEAITKVTLSPWMHPSLVDSVKQTLKSIDGCEAMKVDRTTLISNDEWLQHGQAAT